MPLTKEKEQEVINKITDVIKRKRGKMDFKCPVCTNDQFTLAGGFTNDFLTDKLSGNLILGGLSLPSVPIVCTNCGNTFFLNAKVLGIDFEEENRQESNKENNEKQEKKNE